MKIALLAFAAIAPAVLWLTTRSTPQTIQEEEEPAFRPYVGYEACIVMRRLAHETPGESLTQRQAQRWSKRGGGGPVRVQDMQKCALSYERPCDFWWSRIKGNDWRWLLETDELAETHAQLTLTSWWKDKETTNDLKLRWGTRLLVNVTGQWFSVRVKPCS